MQKMTVETYRAFLIRLWRQDAETVWRGTLQDTHTGEQQHFATVVALVEQLFTMTRGASHEQYNYRTPE